MQPLPRSGLYEILPGAGISKRRTDRSSNYKHKCLRRKNRFCFAKKQSSHWRSAFRLFIGLVLPLVFALISFGKFFFLIIAGFCLGELIDRAEFYLEMDILSPARQAAIDLQKWIDRDSAVR